MQQTNMEEEKQTKQNVKTLQCAQKMSLFTYFQEAID